MDTNFPYNNSENTHKELMMVQESLEQLKETVDRLMSSKRKSGVSEQEQDIENMVAPVFARLAAYYSHRAKHTEEPTERMQYRILSRILRCSFLHQTVFNPTRRQEAFDSLDEKIGDVTSTEELLGLLEEVNRNWFTYKVRP